MSTPAVLDFTSTNLADSPRGIVSWSGTTVPSVDARRTVRSSVSRTPSRCAFSTATSTVTVHTRLRGTTFDASAFKPSRSPAGAATAGGSRNATSRIPAGGTRAAAACCVIEMTP